ncbi:hypothetical protein A5658_11250 [Mycobacterium sp. 1245111.1]|uniref:DUF3632 domain-containing protein n=1 Tax=Mycobacterium sp. 1245111.1 TaxID=1834073 RepID=UPI00080153D6|nr:DUF3632 domain-containing protein [Mycobacterium sp. 1245111.1]OBK34405.1 hypothetical protein A5658_11250 [Mycobacterium sp. 1245111.1]
MEWFRLAGPLLASLTRQREAGYRGRSHILGARAQRAGLTVPGFNPARWDFWRTRLAEIAASGGDAGPVARRGLDDLLAAG